MQGTVFTLARLKIVPSNHHYIVSHQIEATKSYMYSPVFNVWHIYIYTLYVSHMAIHVSSEGSLCSPIKHCILDMPQTHAF